LCSGSQLLVCAVFTTKEGWHCRIFSPVEIERTGDMREDAAAATRVVAAGFERYIAAAPTDWHMFQPAWEEDETEPTGVEPSLAAPA